MYRTPQPDHLYEWDECIGFLSLLIPSLPRSLCATHYSPTLNPDEASRDLASIALRWLAPKPRGRTAGSGASDHLQDEPFILRARDASMAYPCRIRQSQTGHISHYSYSLVSVSQSQLPFFLFGELITQNDLPSACPGLVGRD